MGQPLSMDLRSRVLAAVDGGASCRKAARFGVAPSTAIRWHAQRRATGSLAPRPQGGDRRSRRIEEHRDKVLAIREAAQDVTLDELRIKLARTALTVSNATPHRFSARHGVKHKKTDHAVEQDRPDALRQREDWLESQVDLGPAPPRVHRPNLDSYQHDPQPRPLCEGRAAADVASLMATARRR